ncbi:hypothetical protein PIB30_011508 [Stylosanthes scabra]|uniref:Uncharacterized protein n=1 Tax=Stylosanthes scabra TaxID=79078 RepID=A0ABU6T6M4_9FABA|nr:hypothetical protein [Stylosanthes scabra]
MHLLVGYRLTNMCVLLSGVTVDNIAAYYGVFVIVDEAGSSSATHANALPCPTVVVIPGCNGEPIGPDVDADIENAESDSYYVVDSKSSLGNGSQDDECILKTPTDGCP